MHHETQFGTSSGAHDRDGGDPADGLLIRQRDHVHHPPADLLVGTWLTQGPSDEPIVVLELTAEGTWTYKWGQTRETVSLAGTGYGTYEVDGDTVTWLGGECEPGAKGVYTFTLENGQFSQTVKDDSCRLRKLAYDGVTFTAETASTSSSGG